jgi:hypothetical protein
VKAESAIGDLGWGVIESDAVLSVREEVRARVAYHFYALA